MFDASFRKLKILVVDDSKTVRTILAQLLYEMEVADVMEAEDGVEAIEKLRKFKADLVICDLNMVPLDGIEFTRLIRNSEDSPNKFLPIIMLTAYSTKTQLNSALKAGVHSFLAKPVTYVTLRSHIAKVLGTPLTFVREGRNLVPQREMHVDEPESV